MCGSLVDVVFCCRVYNLLLTLNMINLTLIFADVILPINTDKL